MDKKKYISRSFFLSLPKGILHLCCMGNSFQEVGEFCSFSASGGGYVCHTCL